MRTSPKTCRVYAHSSLVGTAAAEVCPSITIAACRFAHMQRSNLAAVSKQQHSHFMLA